MSQSARPAAGDDLRELTDRVEFLQQRQEANFAKLAKRLDAQNQNQEEILAVLNRLEQENRHLRARLGHNPPPVADAALATPDSAQRAAARFLKAVLLDARRRAAIPRRGPPERT